jgi:hypothetical protein
VATYVSHPTTVVKETTFPAALSNSVQKLILPIPNNQRLRSNMYEGPASSSQTLNPNPAINDKPHNHTPHAPLHMSHPTIPVPKAFSSNPPKYIQVLQVQQFPSFIHPFQALQQHVQQQAIQQQFLLHQALQPQIPVQHVTSPIPLGPQTMSQQPTQAQAATTAEFACMKNSIIFFINFIV